MVISLVLIEGENVKEDHLRIPLGMAKQLVVGNADGFGIILHIRAESADYLSQALVDFAKVQGVTGVITLAIRSE